MRKGRLVAVSRLALVCAGSFLFSGVGAAFAATASSPRLGPPYEAGGVWFVPAADPFYDVEGVAAEYGADRAGRLTASGERFDPRALTAAHATLPVPGVVEVTNLDTGKVVSLRINDRGPYAPGRILSLTPASARALGMTAGQSAHVRVRYANAPRVQAMRSAPARSREAAAATSAAFGVQVGAFGERARAEQVAAKVSPAGPARVTPVERAGGTLYRVTIGPLASAHAAEVARGELSELGFEGAEVIPAL